MNAATKYLPHVCIYIVLKLQNVGLIGSIGGNIRGIKVKKVSVLNECISFPSDLDVI